MKLERAIGITEFLNMNIETLPFTGEWREAFGRPEAKGIWIIWGDSSNGKTGFALKLAKYLTQFGKGLYNSLEEGKSDAMQNAFRRERMQDIAGKLLLVREPLEAMDARLKQRKSPYFAIVDSADYTGLTKRNFITEYKDRHPNKLIIFVARGTQRDPDTALGRAIKFEAKLKICVSGFIAYNNGRSQGTTNKFVIDAIKAAEFN